MGKNLEINGFQKKLEELNPYSSFKVLEYISMSKPAKIQCLECGKIIEVSSAEKLMTRLNLCDEKHFYSMEQKAKYFSNKYNFEILEWKTEKKRYAKIKCLKCGEINFRHYTHLITNPNHCPTCNNSSDKQVMTIEEGQEKINKLFNGEYKLLQFKSYHSQALFQHKCGFIWHERYDGFLLSRGCPKCYKIKSKGEQYIEQWLKNNGINYICQYGLNPPFKRYKFDFFLPDYNLAIEYQGEQHYKDKSKIWEGLEKVQKRDAIKKEYCLNNNIELLEISYLDIKKIPIILSSKFND